ncbi:MAG: hypothetical protein KDK07_25580 [Bauldia sp.]|nr:hypothetical protein [Bauldia sp.]
MGVERIPEKYIYTCDICGKTKESRDSGRPPWWARIQIERSGYDSGGQEVSDDSRRWLACFDCQSAIEDKIETYTRERTPG